MTFHLRFNAFRIDCIFHILRARFIKYNVCVQSPLLEFIVNILFYRSILFSVCFLFFHFSPMLSSSPCSSLLIARTESCFYFGDISLFCIVFILSIFPIGFRPFICIGVGLSAWIVCFFLNFFWAGGSSTYSVTGVATIPVLMYFNFKWKP